MTSEHGWLSTAAAGKQLHFDVTLLYPSAAVGASTCMYEDSINHISKSWFLDLSRFDEGTATAPGRRAVMLLRRYSCGTAWW